MALNVNYADLELRLLAYAVIDAELGLTELSAAERVK